MTTGLRGGLYSELPVVISSHISLDIVPLQKNGRCDYETQNGRGVSQGQFDSGQVCICCLSALLSSKFWLNIFLKQNLTSSHSVCGVDKILADDCKLDCQLCVRLCRQCFLRLYTLNAACNSSLSIPPQSRKMKLGAPLVVRWLCIVCCNITVQANLGATVLVATGADKGWQGSRSMLLVGGRFLLIALVSAHRPAWCTARHQVEQCSATISQVSGLIPQAFMPLLQTSLNLRARHRRGLEPWASSL